MLWQVFHIKNIWQAFILSGSPEMGQYMTANNSIKVRFISCGIFQPELEQVLGQIQADHLFNCVFEVRYLKAGLHSDLDALKKEMVNSLNLDGDERTIFLYGSKCHPELDAILDRYPVVRFNQDNCIPLLTGENTYGKNAKTFFLTTGWILKWKEIFDSITGLDESAVRQSFGLCDRVIFKNTNIQDISEEALLELFEYTGCPIEIEDIGLDLFKKNIIGALEQVLNQCRA
ncbi:DUF1638 domain-containing protein [Desulforapulum autotrophicum]|nr:DUF1638 domain-containing protein [Desulforapulum autotrophicum]